MNTLRSISINRQRRTLIKSAGIIAAATLSAACITPYPLKPKPGKVRVSEDRIIDQLVGLRPYRRTGFRIEPVKFDEKYIIHNYGHGGAGVTLSWGSAMMAAELAGAIIPAPARVAVIGCGVIGLTSARTLQQRGYQVTIYAESLPPQTTSNVAGALWGATTVADPDRHDTGFPERLKKVARDSYRQFTGMLGADYGVRLIDAYRVGNGRRPSTAWPWEMMLTPELFPGQRELDPQQNPFYTDYGSVYTALHIDPEVFLPRLLAEFREAGGKIHLRSFDDIPSVLTVPENLLVNCTGLGSHRLFKDMDLVPVKGQLVALLPQDEVDYILFSPGGYLMRRRNSIILGGSHEEGNWDLSIDRTVTDRIIRSHREFFDSY